MGEYFFLTLRGSSRLIRKAVLKFQSETGLQDSPILLNRKHLLSRRDFFFHFLFRYKINYLLIEDFLAADFCNFMDGAIKIISSKKVESALFYFQFKTYSSKAATDMDEFICKTADNLNLVLTQKSETLRDSSDPRAFIHAYEQFTAGIFEGEIKKIINLFCRLDLFENLKLGPIIINIIPDSASTV